MLLFLNLPGPADLELPQFPRRDPRVLPLVKNLRRWQPPEEEEEEPPHPWEPALPEEEPPHAWEPPDP